MSGWPERSGCCNAIPGGDAFESWSFGDKCVPKLELGNEDGARSETTAGERQQHSVDLDQLDVEDQITGDWSLASVGEILGNPETTLLTFDHEL
jgi:hypothetical protein